MPILTSSPTDTSFSDKCRAIAWLVILLALVAFALTGLFLDWFWPKIAVPAVIALFMGVVTPGAKTK